MRTLNIIVGNTLEQTKLVYNSYKNSLDNIMDNKVNYIVVKIVHIKPESLKQDILNTQLYTP